MKYYYFTFILFTQSFSSFSQNLAVNEILVNTFMIKTESSQLTAFLIEYQAQEYLITAKHGFKKSDTNNSTIKLSLYYDTSYIKLTGNLRFHKDTSIDIAIIKLNRLIQKLKPLEITDTITLGQDCIFLGFPFGYFYSKLPMTELPTIPFIKKAIISGVANKITFLDGINNPGFSGGPVIIYSPTTQKAKIYGVVSGYYPEYNKISDLSNQKIDSLKYYFNSGIIFCYPISSIKEILQ